MKKTMVYVTAIFVLFFPLTGYAQVSAYPIEGRLLDANGDPVQSASVTFRLQVVSVNNCLLYDESHGPVDMSSSDGYFGFNLGSGSVLSNPLGNINAVFVNNPTNISGLSDPPSSALTNCSSASGNYTPAIGDIRNVRIGYDDGQGMQYLGQMAEVGAVAFANSAAHVGDIPANEVIRRNTAGANLTQADLELVFAAASDATNLRTLIDGNSTSYLSSSGTGTYGVNGQVIDNIGNPVDGNDAVNRDYADDNIGGGDASALPVLGVTEANQVLQWSGSTWQMAAVGTGDLNNGGNGGAVIVGSDDNTLALEAGGNNRVTISANGNNHNFSGSGSNLSFDFSVGNPSITSVGNLSIAPANNFVLNSTGTYLDYRPNGGNCADGGVLKWDNTNGRWDCDTDDDSGATSLDELSDGSIGGGANNVFLGNAAGAANAAGGNSNTGVGVGALNGNTTGSSNTAVGHQAGTAISTGNNNILLGYQAGMPMTTGTNNIVIGNGISTSAASANNELNIGGILNGNLSSGDIAIGTTSPAHKLHVYDPGANVSMAVDNDGAGNAEVIVDDAAGGNATLTVTNAGVGNANIFVGNPGGGEVEMTLQSEPSAASSSIINLFNDRGTGFGNIFRMRKFHSAAISDNLSNNIELYAARGSLAAPAATQQFDVLGTIYGSGADDSINYLPEQASIRFVASENWQNAPVQHGAAIMVSATPEGAVGTNPGAPRDVLKVHGFGLEVGAYNNADPEIPTIFDLVNVDDMGGTPQSNELNFFKSDGIGSGTANVKDDQVIGQIAAIGHDDSASFDIHTNSHKAAEIEFIADEDFTSLVSGARINFKATQVGTSASNDRFAVDGYGVQIVETAAITADDLATVNSGAGPFPQCDNTSLGRIVNASGQGQFVCLQTGGGPDYGWAPLNAGPIACPTDNDSVGPNRNFTLVGEPGKASSFCISQDLGLMTNNGGLGRYINAEVDCRNMNTLSNPNSPRGKAHVCSLNELKVAALDSSLPLAGAAVTTFHSSDVAAVGTGVIVPRITVNAAGNLTGLLGGEDTGIGVDMNYRCCID